MDRRYQELLIAEKGRTFVDIAYSGCGSGCKYCYVPSASEKQALASFEDLMQIADCLNHSTWKDGHIVSFCPNTEPFKSTESTERALFLLQRLQDKRFYIQISTKEYIDDVLMRELDALAKKNAIFVNVSTPVLSSREMEPRAADIEHRISNIERIRLYPYLRCGLYIKPCFRSAVDDVEQYAAVINRTKPDYVCIGPTFYNNAPAPCAALHRPEDAALLIPAQKSILLDFSEKLSLSAECPIVYSSICAIFQTMQKKCSLDLWRYEEAFCCSCNWFQDGNSPQND